MPPTSVGMTINSELDPEDSGDDVKKLQALLIEHGYLAKGLNTGYYGDVTKTAVLKFQLEKGIVEIPGSDTGAGRVGPRPLRSVLNLL